MPRYAKYGLAALGGLIVLAIALPFFIPMGVYKDQITRAVREATGREMTIEGDLSLSFFPPLSVSVEDVKFANAPGASPENMLEVGTLRAGVKLFPFLFGGNLDVTSFVLEDPKIHLEVAANGKPNWEFESGSGTTPQAAPESGEAAKSGSFSFKNVTLDNVRLSGGEITYVDRKTGDQYALSDIDMRVSLPSLDGPLGLDGDLVYKGETLDIDATIANPRAFLDKQPTDIALALDSRLIDMNVKGNLATVATPGATLPVSGTGTASLDVPSVRKLTAWTGSPMEEGGGFGPFSVKGDFSASGSAIGFRNADLRLDEMKGKGEMTVALGGARPKITGHMDFDKIDLRPYDAQEGAKKPAGGHTGGSAQPAEWSDEPIDLSGLKALDADLTMITGSFTTSTVQMGKSRVDLDIVGGLMTLQVAEMALYDGSGKFHLVVDARAPASRIQSNFNLNVIQMQPLLRDILGSALLKGITNVEMTVDTRGTSMRSLLAGLNGKGVLKIDKGALYGINIPKIYREGTSLLEQIKNPGANLVSLLDNKTSVLNLASINLMGADERTTDEETDFSELGLSFQIVNGVFKSDDMHLLNPLLKVLGGGTTNLVSRTLDFNLMPQSVSGKEGESGLAVPVRITGTWEKPKFSFDMCKMNELYGKRLGGNQGIANTLLSVTGDCPGQAGRSREETIRQGAEGLFDNLLKGKSKDKPAEEGATPEDEQKTYEKPEEKKDEDPADKLLDIFRKKR